MPEISVILLTDAEHKKISACHHTSLTPIGEEPLLRKQVRLLRAALGDCQVIVITGYRAEEVCQYAENLPVTLIHNPDYRRGNLTGIRKGLEAATGRAYLIIPHNVFFNWITLAAIRQQTTSCLIVEKSGQLTVEQIGVNVTNGQVQWLTYSSKTKWSKIFYVAPQDTGLLRWSLEQFCTSPWTPHELLNNLIDRGLYLDAIEPSGMVVRCVDSRKDIKKMETIL